MKATDQLQAVIAGVLGSKQKRRPLCGTTVSLAPQALAIMDDSPDRDELKSLFDDAGWYLAIEETFARAVTRQAIDRFQLILYERDRADGDWRQAVSLLSHLSPRPCVILLSGSLDANLWDELVRCGGFDVLKMPFEKEAVMQTLKAGFSIWQNLHTPIPFGFRKQS